MPRKGKSFKLYVVRMAVAGYDLHELILIDLDAFVSAAARVNRFTELARAIRFVS